MTAHKHAHLMAQYAQDAMETAKPWTRWERRDPDYGGVWLPLVKCPVWLQFWEYRRKPRMLTYTVTIPEPMREVPKVRTPYFVAQHTPLSFCLGTVWTNDAHDNWMLEHGLCFATEEDAIAAAKAMMPIKGE